MNKQTKKSVSNTPSVKDQTTWDFPGGPATEPSASYARGEGSIPGWGARIPHASRSKKKMKHKQHNQYCSKFKKTLQNGPHQNILKNKQARKQRSVYLESTLAEITLPRYKQSPEKPPKA